MNLINIGVSRETARINLPLSLFTEFYFVLIYTIYLILLN